MPDSPRAGRSGCDSTRLRAQWDDLPTLAQVVEIVCPALHHLAPLGHVFGFVVNRAHALRLVRKLALDLAFLPPTRRKRWQVEPSDSNPPICLRLPPDVLARWKVTGPSWQTRVVAWLAAP